MKTDQDITDTIMRRVHVVHARRMVLAPRTRFFALVVVTFALGISVSIKNVIGNALAAASSWSGFLFFIGDAFRSTEFFVQLFILGAIILAVFSIRDVCVYCVAHDFIPFLRHAEHERSA
ncbi:MAG: hypothetical protein AAB439_00985 [Patescibacteria group bacterium]